MTTKKLNLCTTNLEAAEARHTGGPGHDFDDKVLKHTHGCPSLWIDDSALRTALSATKSATVFYRISPVASVSTSTLSPTLACWLDE